jgi:hypothetical protein
MLNSAYEKFRLYSLLAFLQDWYLPDGNARWEVTPNLLIAKLSWRDGCYVICARIYLSPDTHFEEHGQKKVLPGKWIGSTCWEIEK